MDHTITIAVSDPIAEYIDERVRSGYDSPDEYIRELVRKDQHDQALLRLRALIEEGLASGPASPMTDEDWAELDALARGDAA